MGSATSILLFGAAIVAAAGGLGVWLALRRPAQSLERKQRDEALAAAQHYTPAERVSPYGQAADPCAPGLSDGERVEAMRALLQRGDRRVEAQHAAAAAASASTADTTDTRITHAPTEPAAFDEGLTTSPMAWKPTMPPDEAEEWEAKRSSRRPRVRDADHQHITVF